MKLTHLALIAICIQLLCCTTVTETLPDGTVRTTKSVDLAVFGRVADTVDTIVVTAQK